MNTKQDFSRMAGIGIALTMLLFHPNGFAQTPKDAFVIGGIVPLSGAYALIGTSMQKGANLAIEERSKVLSKPARILWEDSETKPQTSVQKASKLLAGGVNALFGDAASGQTMAIMPLAAQRKTPLIVTTSAIDQITGANRNRYTFRTSNQSYSEGRLTSAYIKKAGLKSVYWLSVDMQAIREGIVPAWKSEMEAMGVSVLGLDYVPLGSQDYAVVIEKIVKSGAEGVMVGISGADAITFLKQAGQVKLASKVKIFGVGFLDDDVATAVGPDSVGVKTVARYHFSFDTAANKKFVATYRKKYNEWPNAYAGHAYDGINWFLDVVEKTGSWNPEDWVNAFEGHTYVNSVFGPRQMRACDHQALFVGLWAEAVQGTPPQPPYMLKVTDAFPAAGLYPECPK